MKTNSPFALLLLCRDKKGFFTKCASYYRITEVGCCNDGILFIVYNKERSRGVERQSSGGNIG